MTHIDRKYEDPTTWRLKTGGTGVPYKIVGMSGEFEPESASAQMNLVIPASQLLQFATEMFPAVVATGFPVYPSSGTIYGTPLYATKISWRGHVDGKPVDPFGIDPSAPADTYQSAVYCDVDFKTMNEQTQSDPNNPETFLEVSCTGGGHFIHSDAPGGKWKQSETAACADLDADGELTEDVEPNVPMGMSVPTVDWDLSWPRIPYTYWSATLVAKIRAALGRVNNAAMPIFYNAPRGTILFVGYTLKRSFTWRAGNTCQQPINLAMKFQEKRIVDAGGTVRGHNDFWRPGFGWRFLTHKDGSPIYRYHDLTGVFKP
jgi:hypothetical protein